MRLRWIALALALLTPFGAGAQPSGLQLPLQPPAAQVPSAEPPAAQVPPTSSAPSAAQTLDTLMPPPPADAGGAPTSGDLSLDVAVLGGLDKVTARVVTVEAPVGHPVHFGTLEIVARACMKRRPEENPESAAFLDVWDLKSGEPAQSLFRGWMFASSPALSAMEHPIYDIWVLDCRDSSQRAKSP